MLDDLLVVADDAGLVRGESVIAGMRVLLNLVVEPSAALGVAAIIEHRDRFARQHVVIIVCGSNIDMDASRRWVSTAPVHPA